MRRAAVLAGLAALAAVGVYLALRARAPESVAVAPAATPAQATQPGATPGSLATGQPAGGVPAAPPSGAQPGATSPTDTTTAAAVPTVSAAHSADRALRSGETLALEAATIQKDQPVALRFDLELPSQNDEPRPVRVYSPDAHVFETQARLDPARTEARLEIDPAFLQRKAGRYVVEIRTTEPSPMPIRRFALELR